MTSPSFPRAVVLVWKGRGGQNRKIGTAGPALSRPSRAILHNLTSPESPFAHLSEEAGAPSALTTGLLATNPTFCHLSSEAHACQPSYLVRDGSWDPWRLHSHPSYSFIFHWSHHLLTDRESSLRPHSLL